jgi:hypothetical protein
MAGSSENDWDVTLWLVVSGALTGPTRDWTQVQVESEPTVELIQHNIRGTVQRDFLTPVFFIIRLLLVPLDMPRSDFEFFRNFVEIFVFEIDSPLLMTVGSQKLSLRQPIVLTL